MDASVFVRHLDGMETPPDGNWAQLSIAQDLPSDVLKTGLPCFIFLHFQLHMWDPRKFDARLVLYNHLDPERTTIEVDVATLDYTPGRAEARSFPTTLEFKVPGPHSLILLANDIVIADRELFVAQP